MEAEKYLKLLAAKFLNKIMIPNTSTKMEITPLWLMSLVKLESMCPSFTEFADFINHFLPSFLSLSRIAMFILLKQREYERNFKSSSKRVPPSLGSDFDVSKISKFSSTLVNPDDARSNLEILNSCLRFYDERIHCPLDVKHYFYEKFRDSFICSRKEFHMLRDEFGVGDVISIPRNLVSLGDITSIADIQKDYASEESNDTNLSLKEGGNIHANEVIASAESDNCELSKRVSNMRLSSNLEVERDDLSDALCLPLKEANDFTFDCKSSDDVSSKGNSSNSDVGKENFSEEDFPSREETDGESCDNGSSKCISFYPLVQKENFSEEADFPLKEETDPHGSTITASDYCSNGKMSSECISSHSEVGKENLSEDDFPLREETDCESCDNASSKCISFYSHVRKENFSEEADSHLKEEIEPHGSTIAESDFCLRGDMSSECTSSRSDVHKDQYSEEADSHLKEEIEPYGSTITESNFCLRGDMSSECISSHSDVHKDYYSEEASSPLKEETDAKKSTLTNGFYLSTEISNKCILSNFGRQFVISGESFKLINLIELAYHLRESDYSKENTSSSFENSEEVGFYFFDQADFENAKLLEKQFLCAKKYAAMNDLVQEEEFSENKDSNILKDSEDYCQTSIFGEAKNFLKNEFLEYLQETVEEISPAEEVTCSQLQEESEFQEDIEEIHVKEENQEEYSNVKMDNSAVETSKYDDLDNYLIRKILFSVYDFICEIEGNASFCMEKQNLISELELKSKDIYSESNCIKSIRILLYFLDTIKMDLESKKDEASKLRLNLEDVRELYSYDLKNTKEGRELQETAKKFVAESNKVYAGIEKDIADCEWYYRNLEKILDFYQTKCFISSDCESCDDVSSKCISSNSDVYKETVSEEVERCIVSVFYPIQTYVKTIILKTQILI